MKAFTVYQPYAFAIVAGLKHYETRPRRTNIRGRVAVHAGKKHIKARELYMSILAAKNVEESAYHICRESHPEEYGAVVGTVEIADCVPVEEIVDTLTEQERLLGDYSPGRFAWVLKNPIMFTEPFPARGRQGWWTWNQRAAEVSREISREIDTATARFKYSPYTMPGIETINAAVAEVVKPYCNNGEIVQGPTTEDISIGGAPLDVLPFLPLAIPTLSIYGAYRVYRGLDLIGDVSYHGYPVQDIPGTGLIGITTRFTPAEKLESVRFTYAFNFQKDGEQK